MRLPLDFQIPLAAAAGVLLLVLAAEKLHGRRCRAVARLAVGPAGAPRPWVRGVPLVRAVALAAMAWSLATLLFATGGVFSAEKPDEDRRESKRQVTFVADLSPSMLLKDAGPGGDLTRNQRACEVVDAILRRLDGDVVYSVIVFYTDALPVVVDAKDAELVRNVFNGLPLWYVMQPGKTDLGSGVRQTLEHLADYPEESTTVFLLTDGDAIELGLVPKPPQSVRDVYVLGVGDPNQGTFIDDHMSRQDASLLGTLAGRLRGRYIDVNEKHLTTLALGNLARGSGATKTSYGLADLAIFVFAAAALIHVLIPLALEYFGSDWKAVRVSRPVATERAVRA
jgi:Ca-activated chloride channel family protein